MAWYHISADKYGTGQKAEITYNGKTITGEVCKIPLDQLYLDDDSPRFERYVNEYNRSHRESLCDIWSGSREAYNQHMEGFIKQLEVDGELSLTSVLEDVRVNGQTTPGAVHADGRIKDGNLRFAALRALAKEGKEEYFYAIVVGYY